MKKIYKQNIYVIDQGIIGQQHNSQSLGAVLLPLNKKKSIEIMNNSAALKYDSRTSNFATKIQENKNQIKQNIDKFQNRNKDFLKYRTAFDNKLRGTSAQVKQSQNFLGFGNPPNLMKLEEKKTNITSLKQKNIEIAQKIKNQKPLGIFQNQKQQINAITSNEHRESRPLSKQRNDSDQDKDMIQQRKQKKNFLIDLLNKRCEIIDPNKKQEDQLSLDFEIVNINNRLNPFQKKSELDFESKTDKEITKSPQLHELDYENVKVQDFVKGQVGILKNSKNWKKSNSQVNNERQKSIDVQSHNQKLNQMIRMQNQSNSYMNIEIDQSQNNNLALMPAEDNVLMQLDKEVDQIISNNKNVQNNEKQMNKLEIQKLKQELKNDQLERENIKQKILKNKNYNSGTDDEENSNAFMTQFPHAYKKNTNHDNLDIQNGKKFKKSKTFKEQEQKVKKCLNFLGIKDKHMLDHFYPNFEKALELESKQKMIEDFQRKEELQGGKSVEQINQQLELRNTVNKYKYVELYNHDNNKQHKLISRSSALQEDQYKLKMAIQLREQPKRLKICKFDDSDMQRMCYNSFRNAKDEWNLIQRKKDFKEQPYIERVSTVQANNQSILNRQNIIFNKAKFHHVHKKLMEALKQARREKGILDEDYLIENAEELFDPVYYVDEHFKALSLEELRMYLYQSLQLQQIKNKSFQINGIRKQAKNDYKNDLFTESDEQQQTTKFQPSYKETVAFINTLKKKWMIQKGYCSVFDKSRSIKQQAKKSVEKQNDKIRRKQMQKKEVEKTLKQEDIHSQDELQVKMITRSKSSQQIYINLNAQTSDDDKQNQEFQIGSGLRPEIQMSNESQVKQKKFKRYGLIKKKGEFFKNTLSDSERSRSFQKLKSKNSQSKNKLQLFNNDIKDVAQLSTGRKHKLSPKSLNEWTNENKEQIGGTIQIGMSIDINSNQLRNQVHFGGGKVLEKKMQEGAYDDTQDNSFLDIRQQSSDAKTKYQMDFKKMKAQTKKDLENLEKLVDGQTHNIKIYSYGGNESLESNQINDLLQTQKRIQKQEKEWVPSNQNNNQGKLITNQSSQNEVLSQNIKKNDSGSNDKLQALIQEDIQQKLTNFSKQMYQMQIQDINEQVSSQFPGIRTVSEDVAQKMRNPGLHFKQKGIQIKSYQSTYARRQKGIQKIVNQKIKPQQSLFNTAKQLMQELDFQELEIQNIQKNVGDINEINPLNNQQQNDNYDVNVIVYRPKRLSHQNSDLNYLDQFPDASMYPIQIPTYKQNIQKYKFAAIPVDQSVVTDQILIDQGNNSANRRQSIQNLILQGKKIPYITTEKILQEGQCSIVSVSLDRQQQKEQADDIVIQIQKDQGTYLDGDISIAQQQSNLNYNAPSSMEKSLKGINTTSQLKSRAITNRIPNNTSYKDSYQNNFGSTNKLTYQNITNQVFVIEKDVIKEEILQSQTQDIVNALEQSRSILVDNLNHFDKKEDKIGQADLKSLNETLKMNKTIQKNTSQEIAHQNSDSAFYQTGDVYMKNQNMLSIDNDFIVKTQFQSNYRDDKNEEEYANNNNQNQISQNNILSFNRILGDQLNSAHTKQTQIQSHNGSSPGFNASQNQNNEISQQKIYVQDGNNILKGEQQIKNEQSTSMIGNEDFSNQNQIVPFQNINQLSGFQLKLYQQPRQLISQTINNLSAMLNYGDQQILTQPDNNDNQIFYGAKESDFQRLKSTYQGGNKKDFVFEISPNQMQTQTQQLSMLSGSTKNQQNPSKRPSTNHAEKNIASAFSQQDNAWKSYQVGGATIISRPNHRTNYRFNNKYNDNLSKPPLAGKFSEKNQIENKLNQQILQSDKEIEIIQQAQSNIQIHDQQMNYDIQQILGYYLEIKQNNVSTHSRILQFNQSQSGPIISGVSTHNLPSQQLNIQNESYYQKMAKINPQSFAVSGKKVKGIVMTPKQMLAAHKKQQRNQKPHFAVQVDQKKMIDGKKTTLRDDLPLIDETRYEGDLSQAIQSQHETNISAAEQAISEPQTAFKQKSQGMSTSGKIIYLKPPKLDIPSIQVIKQIDQAAKLPSYIQGQTQFPKNQPVYRQQLTYSSKKDNQFLQTQYRTSLKNLKVEANQINNIQSQSSYKPTTTQNYNLPVMNIQGRGVYLGKGQNRLQLPESQSELGKDEIFSESISPAVGLRDGRFYNEENQSPWKNEPKNMNFDDKFGSLKQEVEEAAQKFQEKINDYDEDQKLRKNESKEILLTNQSQQNKQ